tara:strand:+ start:124 stop:471 length:348 start_codon:yes stop_codon:yes gene_type:complete
MKFKSSIYILLITLFFSCGQNSQTYKVLNDTEHLDLLKKEIISVKEIIRFKNIVKFEWDSLIILTPYNLPEKVGEKHNIDLKSIEHFRIKSRDVGIYTSFDQNRPYKRKQLELLF